MTDELLNTSCKKDLGYAKIFLPETGIIEVFFGDNAVIDFKECKEINDLIGEYCNYTKALVLMVTGEETVVEAGSREFSASPEGMQYTIADAIVFKSMAQRLIVNFYLKFNKPPMPSKAFTNVEEAREWLLTFKK